LFAFLAVLMPAGAFCQDAEGAEGAHDNEIASLRAAVERQSARIEGLTREVARLTAILEKNQPDHAAPAAAPAAETQAQSAGAGMPAEAAPPAATHVVARGETLTSIARLHKVGVGELLQANKIVDDRRLQIGQTLVIPARTEKPENTETEHKPTGGN
jgi:LysM repeat protein